MFFAISKECFIHPNMYMSVRRELENSTRELGNFTIELRNFEITRHPMLKSIYNGAQFGFACLYSQSVSIIFRPSALRIEMSCCSKSLPLQYSKSNWISNWKVNRIACGVPLMALRSITACYFFICRSIRKTVSTESRHWFREDNSWILPVWFLLFKRNLTTHLS